MNQLALTALLLLALTACTDAEFTRGSAKACDPCTWDGDCADGFFCDTDGTPPPMVCKTAKMAAESTACEADCIKVCAYDGRCGVKEIGGKPVCAPRNAADCLQSEVCQRYGDCLFCTYPSGAMCEDKCP